VNRQRDVTAFLYYGGAHDAVIDDPTECERIWDTYTKRRMAQSGQSFFSNRPRYSLSRHLRCSGCGGRMQTALRNKKYRRPLIDGLPNPLDVTFRCANHIDSKSCPKNGTYISLAVAEQWFLEWLDREAQTSGCRNELVRFLDHHHPELSGCHEHQGNRGGLAAPEHIRRGAH
jgi:hypothetical protein